LHDRSLAVTCRQGLEKPAGIELGQRGQQKPLLDFLVFHRLLHDCCLGRYAGLELANGLSAICGLQISQRVVAVLLAGRAWGAMPALS
jgi:hypothetical protein